MLPNSVMLRLVNRRDGSTITLKKGDRLVNEKDGSTITVEEGDLLKVIALPPSVDRVLYMLQSDSRYGVITSPSLGLCNAAKEAYEPLANRLICCSPRITVPLDAKGGLDGYVILQAEGNSIWFHRFHEMFISSVKDIGFAGRLRCLPFKYRSKTFYIMKDGLEEWDDLTMRSEFAASVTVDSLRTKKRKMRSESPS